MNLRQRILERVSEYELKAHPEFDQGWIDIILNSELKSLRKKEFYTLSQILDEFGTVYLSHNAEIEIGLNFEKVCSYLKIHDNPKDIPIIDEERICDTKSIAGKYSFLSDTSSKVFTPFSLTHRYKEDLFGLSHGTFQCTFTQAGFGTTLNLENQLTKFLCFADEEKIPYFVNTVDLEPHNQNKTAYVIGGFEV